MLDIQTNVQMENAFRDTSIVMALIIVVTDRMREIATRRKLTRPTQRLAANLEAAVSCVLRKARKDPSSVSAQTAITRQAR